MLCIANLTPDTTNADMFQLTSAVANNATNVLKVTAPRKVLNVLINHINENKDSFNNDEADSILKNFKSNESLDSSAACSLDLKQAAAYLSKVFKTASAETRSGLLGKFKPNDPTKVIL